MILKKVSRRGTAHQRTCVTLCGQKPYPLEEKNKSVTLQIGPDLLGPTRVHAGSPSGPQGRTAELRVVEHVMVVDVGDVSHREGRDGHTLHDRGPRGGLLLSLGDAEGRAHGGEVLPERAHAEHADEGDRNPG